MHVFDIDDGSAGGCVDVFDDVFGPASDSSSQGTSCAAALPSVLPRASSHPHFAHYRQASPPASFDHVCALLDALTRERGEPCARGLRKSRSQYGKDCAKSLLRACEVFHEGGAASSSLPRHARATADLCSTAIEEANWDVSAWSEANLIALCLLLATLLSRHQVESADEPSTTVTVAESIGKAAIALFNLCVAALSPLPADSAPAWVPCTSALLRCAEAAAVAAWPSAAGPTAGDDDASSWRIPTQPPTLNGLTPTLDPSRRVLEIDAASLPCAAFFERHLQRGVPVLVRGHLDAEKWAAMEYFADLRRLHADAGERLVPVNLGTPLVGYAGVVHWPLRKLIEERLLPSNRTHDAPLPAGQPPDEEAHVDVAYMTQHHLLHQQPALQELLAVPPYILGRELSPTNVWIGTRGTVTSLHSDPSDNLLCQAAGFKYFRLYGLDQTSKIYATTQRANNTNSFGTSPVRVEAPLPPEHGLAADAAFVEGLLAPGDMLFIPKSMWHYVRSLTTSVSINFWF